MVKKMSDPVTNVEIEDVLSSIRRLVSTEDRPGKSGADAAASAPDKLVLTPSLRVDHHDGPQVDEPESDEPEAENNMPDQVSSDLPAQGDDMPPADDVFAPQADKREASAADAVSGDATEESLLHEDMTPDAADIRASADLKAAPDGETGRAAIFQRAAGTNDDEWEPDESSDAAEATISETLAADVGDEPDALEGLEPFTPEPDIPDAAEQSPCVAEEEPAAMPEPENAFLSEEDIFTEDETILDEEALRDLVAEIVRQELQGALGERITRNVRKLVRREIQRALAAQELQ